jgi:uncharacterized protein YutE (UPF0331/DUF86 family)
VDFRNWVVHLYWEVGDKMVYRILRKNMVGFETYIEFILAYSQSEIPD